MFARFEEQGGDGISVVIIGKVERKGQRKRPRVAARARNNWGSRGCGALGQCPRCLARLRPGAGTLVVDCSDLEGVGMAFAEAFEEVSPSRAATFFL